MLRRFPGVLGANLNIMRESIWEDTKTVTLLIEQEEDERMKWRSILQIMLSYGISAQRSKERKQRAKGLVA